MRYPLTFYTDKGMPKIAALVHTDACKEAYAAHLEANRTTEV